MESRVLKRNLFSTSRFTLLGTIVEFAFHVGDYAQKPHFR